MKNIKKVLAGLTAVSLVGSLAGCSGGGDPAETVPEVTTAPAVTVEINSETLSQEDQEQIGNVADTLTGELENKTIKWFSFYDPFHPTTAGNTKALSLELFEAKYDGNIEYIETTWQNRFNDLSTRIIGGDGIDFIAGGDLDSFPKGIPSGQFESYDSYIDWNDPLWAEWKELNDKFIVNGKHYIICPQSTLGQVVVYNRGTVEAMGFDDPAELFAKGEWNWDTFKGMLLDYGDPAQDQYGLDGWFNEQPLMLTGGVPSVEFKDGKLVHNLNDPTLERVMNFMYGLNTSGLVLDKSLFSWTEHPEFIGEGRELFYIGGMYVLESAPEVWSATFVNQEDVMFVPRPTDPDGSEYYGPAGLEGYMLCKG
ncbi:MAG: extracellular solute-binding protein, partial [Oscillospiraceae bacterium]|nr:extracellular solute-binding protein [Oscillospiraceae bacterium]